MAEADDTRQLYERFVKVVGEGVRDELFTDDDLLDIYDYATDMADDGVRFEIFLYAARHGIVNDELETRRRYFNYFLGADTLVMQQLKQIADTATEASLLDTILSIRLRFPKGQGGITAIEKCLEVTADSTLDDEEVIQLIDYMASSGNMAWLDNHVKLLEQRAQYPATVSSEMASLYEQRRAYDKAAEYVDAMTMSEPFNADHWVRLAQMQMMSGRYEDALSSLEYAVAVDPDNPNARRIRAYTMVMRNEEDPQALELLLKCAKKDNIDDPGMTTLARALTAAGRDEEARKMLASYVLDHPEAAAAMRTLSFMLPDKVSLSPFIADANITVDRQYWLNWIGDLIDDNMPRHAMDVVDEALCREILPETHTTVVQARYYATNLEELCEDMLPHLKDGLSDTAALFVLHTMFIQGNAEEALTHARERLQRIIGEGPRLDDPAPVAMERIWLREMLARRYMLMIRALEGDAEACRTLAQYGYIDYDPSR